MNYGKYVLLILLFVYTRYAYAQPSGKPNFTNIYNYFSDQSNYKKQVPSEIYTQLGIDIFKIDGDIWPVQILFAVKKENKQDIVILLKRDGESAGSFAELPKKDLFLFILNKELMIAKNAFQIETIDEPIQISFTHDCFLEISTKFQEREIDRENFEIKKGLYYTKYEDFALFENKIKSFSDYSKNDLRMIRNHIFARYGYIFKSKDLNDYFSKYSWYKPMNKNVDKFLTDRDKRIMNKISLLEK